MIRSSCVAGLATFASLVFAQDGWSRFDERNPIYLEGVVKAVKWQNPHASVKLEVNGASAPAALPRFAVPKQTAAVDAVIILGTAQPPARKDRVWHVEFAPIATVDAWKVTAPSVGDKLAVVGYAFKGDQGDATLRVEFLIGNGKVTPMRSSPK